jgi:hypothetical protein
VTPRSRSQAATAPSASKMANSARVSPRTVPGRREVARHGVAQLARTRARRGQHPQRDPVALSQQPEQDVRRLDLAVPELHRLRQRGLQRRLCGGGERDRLPLDRLAEPDRLDHLRPRALARQGQRPPARERHQQVLGADMPVPHQPRLGLRVDDDLTGLLGEAIEHGYARRRYPRANKR